MRRADAILTPLTTRRMSVLVAAGYLLLVLAMSWPLPARLDSHVQDTGDPLMQTWVLRAVQHRLVRHPLDLWDANIYYPFPKSLAYSEETISSALLGAPVWLLSGNAILMYNLLLLATFWLAAFGTFLLARAWGAVPGAAVVAGVVAAFAPARFGHISHLNLLTLCWLPLVLYLFTRFARERRPRWAVAGGLALAAQLLASLQIGAIALLGLAIALPPLLWGAWRARHWSRGELAWLAGALLLPLALLALTLPAHAEVAARFGFERDEAEVRAFAATPGDLLAVFPTNTFSRSWLATTPEPFFPGAVTLLGVALCALAWRERSARGPLLVIALLVATGTVLSFGLSVTIAGHEVTLPYRWLYDRIELARTVRGVGRFGLLTAAALPAAAALGYSALWRRLAPRLGGHAWRAGLLATLALVLIASVELHTRFATTPAPGDQELAIYDWLAEQEPGPVAEFPTDGLNRWGAIFEPIRAMYGSTRHWNPTTAGYGSYPPEPHWYLIGSFKTESGQTMVTPANVGLLQDLGIHWVLFHPWEGYDIAAALSWADRLPELSRAGEANGSVAYRLAAAPASRIRLIDTTLGDFEAATSTVAAGTQAVTARLRNPNVTASVARLVPVPDVQITWRRADGSVALRETRELPVPFALPPGETTLPFTVRAPDEPGAYRLEARCEDTLVAPLDIVVTVATSAATGQPSPSPPN